MISLINYDSSEGEQWGRYNLPRYMSILIKIILFHLSWYCNILIYMTIY